ncbi:hypothetical protein J6590_014082 [Homalodisca vitripennis]|nr:hypothetical protein J6590_014082 [Homalodisca vitripennis]
MLVSPTRPVPDIFALIMSPSKCSAEHSSPDTGDTLKAIRTCDTGPDSVTVSGTAPPHARHRPTGPCFAPRRPLFHPKLQVLRGENPSNRMKYHAEELSTTLSKEKSGKFKLPTTTKGGFVFINILGEKVTENRVIQNQQEQYQSCAQTRSIVGF